jgi:hypothetical protein
VKCHGLYAEVGKVKVATSGKTESQHMNYSSAKVLIVCVKGPSNLKQGYLSNH